MNVIDALVWVVVITAIAWGGLWVLSLSARSPSRLVAAGELIGLRRVDSGDLLELKAIESETNLRINGLLGADGSVMRLDHDTPGVSGFGIVTIETDVVIGTVTFSEAQRAHDPIPALEFGILLRDDVKGQGIGTEATSLAIRHVLQTGTERIIAGCSIDNTPMRIILEKLAGAPYHRGPLTLPNGDEVTAVWFAFTDTSRLTLGAEAESEVDSG